MRYTFCFGHRDQNAPVCRTCAASTVQDCYLMPIPASEEGINSFSLILPAARMRHDQTSTNMGRA